MCIIVYKDHNVKKPTKQILETCWESNPHGAGLAIMKKDHVDIEKGFMSFNEFYDYANDMVKDDDAVAYHLRIATSGGINQGMTHPFPVTDQVNDLKAISMKAKRAFIHNGVLSKGTPELSDTAIYVRDFLSKYSLKDIQDKVPSDTVGSRTIVMDSETQKAYMTGTWITDDKTGLMFSNDSYLPYEPYVPPFKYYKRDANSTTLADDYDDYAFNGKDFYITCPHCKGEAELISEYWGMYECTECHEIIDHTGTPMF